MRVTACGRAWLSHDITGRAESLHLFALSQSLSSGRTPIKNFYKAAWLLLMLLLHHASFSPHTLLTSTLFVAVFTADLITQTMCVNLIWLYSPCSVVTDEPVPSSQHVTCCYCKSLGISLKCGQ